MNSANETIYNGYTIEKMTGAWYYDNKKISETTTYQVTKQIGTTLYFYRSARLESFTSLEQAKRAIRNKRIFACGAIANV